MSDIVLDKPIRAQGWRLDVNTATMELHGGQFGYNWKMYESLDTETVNVPMKMLLRVFLEMDTFKWF